MKSTKFDSSTFIQSVDQSFNDHTVKPNIIFQKGPPLHAFYDVYFKKNYKNHFLKPISTSSKQPNHQPIFGTSDTRHEQSYLVNKKSLIEPGPGTYDADSSFIEKSAVLSPKKSKQKEMNRLGFNIGSDLKRIKNLSSRNYRNGPGPGQYEMKSIFNYLNQKNNRKIHKSCNILRKHEQIEQKYLQKNDQTTQFRQLSYLKNPKFVPGPGAYNVDPNIIKSPSTIRQQWRQKIKNRITKNNPLKEISKLSHNYQPLIKLDEEIENMGESRVAKKNEQLYEFNNGVQKNEKCKQQSNNKEKVKNNKQNRVMNKNLLRKQLTNKTSKFLPNLLVKEGESQTYSSLKFDNKNKPSNCFLIKNDNAYSSYIVRPKEREGNYLFFAGKNKGSQKNLKPSHMFASVSKRTVV